MKNLRRLFAIVVIVVLMFSLCINAFAVSGYLIALDGVYMQYVDPGDPAYFYAVKSDGNYFTAAEVSTLGTPFVIGNDYLVTYSCWAEWVDIDAYIVVLEVIPNISAQQGSVAVEVTVGTDHVDFVVAVNNICSTSVSDISAAYFDPNGVKITEITDMTVYASDFYGNSQFPSANDAVYRTWYDQLSAQGTRLLNYDIDDVYGTTSYYVHELSFSNGTYTESSSTMTGWQYRIYRGGVQLSTSAVVSSDEILLHDGDEIIWAFGVLDTIDFDALYANAF